MPNDQSPQEVDALLSAIEEIALRAGEEILKIYAAGAEGEGPAVREKADATPVTEADAASAGLESDGWLCAVCIGVLSSECYRVRKNETGSTQPSARRHLGVVSLI